MVTLKEIAKEWSKLGYGDVREDKNNGYFLFCRKGHNEIKKLGSYHIHLWVDYTLGYYRTGVTLKNGHDIHIPLNFRGSTANEMAKNIYIDSGYNTNKNCKRGTRSKSKRLIKQRKNYSTSR